MSFYFQEQFHMFSMAISRCSQWQCHLFSRTISRVFKWNFMCFHAMVIPLVCKSNFTCFQEQNCMLWMPISHVFRMYEWQFRTFSLAIYSTCLRRQFLFFDGRLPCFQEQSRVFGAKSHLFSKVILHVFNGSLARVLEQFASRAITHFSITIPGTPFHWQSHLLSLATSHVFVISYACWLGQFSKGSDIL